MRARQTPRVIDSPTGIVGSYVLLMTLGELLDGSGYSSDPTRLPHALRREIRVCARAVPVSGHGLRIEADNNAKVLGQTLQYISRNETSRCY